MTIGRTAPRSKRKAEVSDREDLMAELAHISDLLDKHPMLLARRRQLFAKARTMNPPIKIRELAAVARVTEVAIAQQLRKGKQS